MTCPDPQGKYVLPDGVEVPMGKGIDSAMGQSSLLYNEYPLTSSLLSCSNLVQHSCLTCRLFLTQYSSKQHFVKFCNHLLAFITLSQHKGSYMTYVVLEANSWLSEYCTKKCCKAWVLREVEAVKDAHQWSLLSASFAVKLTGIQLCLEAISYSLKHITSVCSCICCDKSIMSLP